MRKRVPASVQFCQSSADSVSEPATSDASAGNLKVGGSKQPYSLLRSIDYLSRCVASVGVLIMLAATSWSILNKPSQSNQSKLAVPEPIVGPEQTEQFLDGQWQFAGIPWAAKLEQLSKAEAFHKLSLPPEKSLVGIESDGNGLEHAFEILESLNAAVNKTAFGTEYRVESETYRIVGWASASSPKSIQSIRLAQSNADGNWSYVELSARSTTTNESTRDAHLLPLVEGAAGLATKRDSSGNLLAELVLTEIPFSGIKGMWQGAGWQVQDAASGDFVDLENSAGFAEIKELLHEADGSRSTLICTKDDSTIAVIAKKSPATDSHTLLVFRLAQ